MDAAAENPARGEFYELMRFRFVRAVQSLIRRTRDGRRTFFEVDQFPWVAEVEARWPEIRKELDAQLETIDAVPNFQDLQTEQLELTQDDRWKMFLFVGYGEENAENLAQCPNTASALRLIPGMHSAMFSILQPGKHIPPHTGPHNGVLRYHLGLRIPEKWQDCGIRVGDETRSWREGKSIIFDDVHDHEAWNHTDEIRVVLFVDVERVLPAPLNWLNRAAIYMIRQSPFIQDAMENLDRWNRKLAGRR